MALQCTGWPALDPHAFLPFGRQVLAFLPLSRLERFTIGFPTVFCFFADVAHHINGVRAA